MPTNESKDRSEIDEKQAEIAATSLKEIIMLIVHFNIEMIRSGKITDKDKLKTLVVTIISTISTAAYAISELNVNHYVDKLFTPEPIVIIQEDTTETDLSKVLRNIEQGKVSDEAILALTEALSKMVNTNDNSETHEDVREKLRELQF